MKAVLPRAAALLFVISGCAASVNTVSRVTYQDPTFDLVKLQQGGLAILPILAGAGVEGYRRPFGESLNVQADSLYGAQHVVRWDAAMTAINGAGLSGPYGDAISIYRETSILPSDILLQIGQAVKSRYLLVVTLNPPTSNSRQKYSILTGNVYTEQKLGVDAYGQVWDAVEGDIVWEGVGAASATSSEFTYVKDQAIDTYSALTARALVGAVVGR